MEDKNLNEQFQSTENTSDIIFGTSSDAIEQGLHDGQFVAEAADPGIDEKDQIVNEQEQNEIVNPSEENFNEELAPQSIVKDSNVVSEKQEKMVPLEENVIDLDSDEDTLENSGNISKSEN